MSSIDEGSTSNDRDPPDTRPTPEQFERKGSTVLQIETETKRIRGIVISKQGEPILRIRVGHPPEFANAEIEIKKDSLAHGKPFEYRQGANEWSTSSALKSLGFWRAGSLTSVADLETASLFPNSQHLPSNPFTSASPTPDMNDQYEAQLKSYEWHIQPDRDQTNSKAMLPYGAQCGWKIHINATPTNVVAISNYLKTNNYEHKYLSGGDASDGKVFTIYLGSMQKMQQWAPVLSNDLRGHLAAPGASDETEVAPGLSARFDVGSTRGTGFHRYGYCGVPLQRSSSPTGDAQILLRGSRSEKVAAVRSAFESLREEYGSYFTG